MFGAKNMSPYKLECGNSKDLLKTLADNSIDAIVTDPPYELGFMGKKWDASGIAYDVDLWRECLRVLKPGGHLLAFSGSRTYHRMTVAIEDAGFDIRDQIMWIYGSGFPKSHNIGKQENCEKWNGWGTALKPAHEPICVARKPLIGTVAENVLTHGTGAMNVDACRVQTNDYLGGGSMGGPYTSWNVKQGARPQTSEWKGNTRQFEQPTGRWPANIIHDGSAEVLAGFPEVKSGGLIKPEHNDIRANKEYRGLTYHGWGVNNKERGYTDKGSAARFFYCAKASKKDRDEGLDGFEEREARSTNWSGDGMPLRQDGTERKQPIARNHHPTVKPTNLMQYLCRLVTPPNGVILDPFLGSGSTGKAAIYEGFQFVGFDLSAEYVEISRARIEYAMQKRNEISKQKENTLFED
jgi:site-specific DNA-methyltransferase (adenine-specific)